MSESCFGLFGLRDGIRSGRHSGRHSGHHVGRLAALVAGGLLAFAATCTPVQAATGGPDTYGYTWRDSAEPGVTYAWEEISATGRDITGAGGDDSNTGFQPMSFLFPYYGSSYNQVSACTNGWASFVDATSITYGNVALPTVGIPTGCLAAYWNDLQVVIGTGHIYFQDFGDHVVIEWQNANDLGVPADVDTFELILWSNGLIVVQYQSVLGLLTSATMGIERPDETDGLTVFANPAVPSPSTNYRVQFDPPRPVTNNLNCSGATPITCGQRVNGDNRLGTANQDSYFCSRGDYSGKEQIYSINLATPTSVRFLLTAASGNPDMIVLSSCDANACVAAPSDRVVLNNVTGTFYVVVDSAPGMEGPYSIRVDCNPAPVQVNCAGAAAVNCGDIVSGDLNLGTARQDSYWCTDNDYAGKEQVYRIDLTLATTLSVTLTPHSGNPDIIVLNGCDPTSCVGTPGDAISQAVPVGTYYIVVDCAPGQEGTYDLLVQCNPMPPLLDCANATPINCGSIINGNLNLGDALQPSYSCSVNDYRGKEQVYRIDLVAATQMRIILDRITGAEDLIVLNGCNPSNCVGAPGGMVSQNFLPGTYFVVVDCAPGNEGTYRLKVQCQPVPNNVPCAGATVVNCGDSINGDLALGSANQSIYWCSPKDFSGNEQVYVVNLAAATRLGITLTELSGNPDLLIIGNCDPNNCTYADNGQVAIAAAGAGPVYIVVDCAAGEEGQYRLDIACLQDDMPFCSGQGVMNTNYWNDNTGTWNVDGWLYDGFDSHNIAFRVDGNSALTYDSRGNCTNRLVSTGFGVNPPMGPAFTTWSVPQANVREDLYETNAGTCCGLMVSITVTNTDTVPHFYEFRIYHDLAFGQADGTGICAGGTIDGGPIQVNGVGYTNEMDLLPVGGDTCAGQIECFSGDHPTSLRASYQMLGPNTPTNMEWDQWNDGGQPCTTWTGFFSDAAPNAGCNGSGTGDSSLLFIWRFPQAVGMLAPGQSASARYRIGMRCEWPCNVICESPTLGNGTAVDAGPCHDGIRLTWDPAVFPGGGRGVYHVYRSQISAADALTLPPITGPAGITSTTYVDGTTAANQTYFYVIQAESTDFPGCGTGPLVGGSTDEITPLPTPVTDFTDVTGPAVGVGAALRATGHPNPSSVSFVWPLAPSLGVGEHYLMLRANDNPQGPFSQVGTAVPQSWTDVNAPPTYAPAHCWYYDLRIADDCGNTSTD